jgi:hypothetical protein
MFQIADCAPARNTKFPSHEAALRQALEWVHVLNRACAGNAFAAACWAALNRDAGQAPAVIQHKHSSIGEPAPAEPKHHNTPTASQHPAKGGSP